MVGCGLLDHPSATTGHPLTPITVGALEVPDAAPAYIARQNGYFRAEGLNVTIEPIQGAGPALPALLGGSLQVIQANYVTVIQAAASGQKLLVIADNYQAAPGCFVLMVRKDSPIKSMADLKGLKVGVATRKSIGSLTVASALGVHGLKESDVDLVEFRLPEMVAALQKGIIAAAWLTEPFITQGEADHGLERLQDMIKDGPMEDFPIAGWAVSATWAAKNPRLVAAFQRAIIRAQHDAADDRNAVTQVIPTYTKIPPQTAGIITLGTFPTSLDADRIQRVANAMLEHGYLTKKFDVRPLLAPALTPTTTGGHS
ncbi:ABC transporter substrate-binding protein (plasmid) [Streptosporangium sp. CA-135522]|uniref:ABC transporter substrate-binding protein n=1 Tax=Streptosporangium sp. CA-135522 TaxID=3240072 RepID=UPI003D8EE342